MGIAQCQADGRTQRVRNILGKTDQVRSAHRDLKMICRTVTINRKTGAIGASIRHHLKHLSEHAAQSGPEILLLQKKPDDPAHMTLLFQPLIGFVNRRVRHCQ